MADDRLLLDLNCFSNSISMNGYFSGDYSGGETLDPIPNSIVKPSSANGTAWETLRESRTSPGIKLKSLTLSEAFFIYEKNYDPIIICINYRQIMKIF